jgi:ABC-type uncharacterized transport system involved in gliding motility auxiliary subunit
MLLASNSRRRDRNNYPIDILSHSFKLQQEAFVTAAENIETTHHLPKGILESLGQFFVTSFEEKNTNKKKRSHIEAVFEDLKNPRSTNPRTEPPL